MPSKFKNHIDQTTAGVRRTVMQTRSDVNRMDSDPQPITIAFEPFYREHYPAVVGLVYTLTGSRPGAEDIAQEAFLRAHRNWGQVSGYERPGGWVRVVAMNLGRSRLRRLGAESRALTRFAGVNVNTFPELEDPNEKFWAAVRALPRRQREVVALHYLEDMATSDIAVLLEIAPSTVKNSLAQARLSLAKTLEMQI
jgi:RNA polymerase sigma-70 factor (ECF subfamily)